jgi:hypothetical protein
VSLSPDGNVRRLDVAVVLGATEDACTVFAEGRRRVVGFASTFPSPRAERVSPGHLVAVATIERGYEAVLWRWFDAVVLDADGDEVTLWEPAHGMVVARPRDRHEVYVPGTRAYLSAGLPGANWWVSGSATGPAEAADVELDALVDFYTENDLWERVGSPRAGAPPTG